jgi:tetratricopeptide (TPR) repeat protein
VRGRIFTLAAVLALAAGAALADRETAQFTAGRADKALAAKKWEDALGLYRKALDEDATYLPARYGLAQALVGSGASAQAVEELRAFVDAVRATDPPPAEWKTLLAKAEKQLADLDASGAALQKLLDQFADDAASLAEKWLTKDPAFAERTLRRGLRLKPGHAKSAQLLEKLGKSASSEVISLFDGKSLKGWEFANPPIWQVIDGEIVGDVRDAATYTRSERRFEGDYDVRLEARRIEEHPGPTWYGVLPAWTAEENCYDLGNLGRKIVWFEGLGKGKDRDIVNVPYEDLKTPFDPQKWNLFELRIRGGKATALVNGEVVGEDQVPATRKGGFIGLKVQDVKAAFRKIEVELR